MVRDRSAKPLCSGSIPLDSWKATCFCRSLFFETQEGIAFLNRVSFKYFEPPFGGSFFILNSHILEARVYACTKTKKLQTCPRERTMNERVFFIDKSKNYRI